MTRLFACVRVKKISTKAALRSAERHGLRLDDASARRVDRSRTASNLAESAYLADKPLELVNIFDTFKAKTGAVEGGGRATIMLHLLCIVSPEILGPDTDWHNPQNSMNKRLFEQAQCWARNEFGSESLLAARLDVDEAGVDAVDLFICPPWRVRRAGCGREHRGAAGRPGCGSPGEGVSVSADGGLCHGGFGRAGFGAGGAAGCAGSGVRQRAGGCWQSGRVPRRVRLHALAGDRLPQGGNLRGAVRRCRGFGRGIGPADQPSCPRAAV